MKAINIVQSKEQRIIRKMFDVVAPTYDFANHLFSFGLDMNWRNRLVEQVLAHSPATVLDLATGTGDVAFKLAQRYQHVNIIGIDLSEEMLRVAKHKAEKKNLQSRVRFISGYAENLALPTDSVDVATISFGIRNFHDIDAALSEIRRILKPQGRLFILEFSKPHNTAIQKFYDFYTKIFIPNISGLLFRNRTAYRYLHDSVKLFPEGKEFANLLVKSGFSNVSYTSLTLGIATLYQATKENNY